MAIKDPKRIEYISDLEKRINNEYEDRVNTYFFIRGEPRKARPIEEVVEWSLSKGKDDTKRQELDGCLKWGLCETAPIWLNVDD